MIEAGQQAPNFQLPSDSGETISLEQFRGKKNVVLYFYPKDNTSGCTREAQGFRDALEEFTKRDTVILGVSPDSIKSHQNFKAKHQLNFPLLSDPEHQVAEMYGAWGKKKMYGREYMGIIRSTFVIDKDGIVRRVFPKVKVAGHVEEVLKAVDELSD
jgi:peroxiredoxin Q/BCP